MYTHKQKSENANANSHEHISTSRARTHTHTQTPTQEHIDSEDVSEQRASACLPDSVPIESEEERAAREAADEMAVLDAVGDYEADPNVMMEDVPQDIVIKTLKVSCA